MMKLLLLFALLAPQQRPADEQTVLEIAGQKRGLVVHLGCGNGGLASEIGKKETTHLIHALALTEENLGASRHTITEAGLYGRVSAEQLDGDQLPYADNLVNILIDSTPNRIPRQELMRVLSPLGILLTNDGNAWKQAQKPWTAGMAEWTHYNYNAGNTATPEDEFIGPPNSIQWTSGPNYSRSHETDPSQSALVSARGRLFYIQDEGPIGITDQRVPAKWSLIARDGFSGVLLWKIPMENWGWQAWKPESIYGKDWRLFIGDRILNPSGLMRRLVADGDRLYVTPGYFSAVSEIDAATGTVLRTFEGTERASELIHKDGRLYMVIGKNTTGVLGKQDTEKMTEAGLACVDLKSGGILWRKKIDAISVWSLCADAGKVYYFNGSHVIALNDQTGEQMWESELRTRGNLNLIRPGVSLASYRGVLLLITTQGLSSISLETGYTNWHKKRQIRWAAINTPPLLLSSGLVWSFELAEGYDPKTGDVVRKLDRPDWLISDGHHARCYQGRNTERYLMTHKRGIEFWDTRKNNDYMKYDWARANCRVGFAPANGMIYFTPHPCQCYMGNRLVGFNALLKRTHALSGISTSPGKLVKGTAVAVVADTHDTECWPQFRHDALRSGSIETKLSPSPELAWTAKLGGQLTQPVMANGRVFVATKNSDSVFALDVDSGEELWRFIAGGGIDSSPTYYRGLLLFGCRDGWVYCLSADTGALAWRFRAAPEERLITAYGRLESTWPVHGSVLVLNDVAYFHAGRNTHLDGGLFVYGVDPITGAVKHFKQLETRREDIAEFAHGPYDMPGTREDLMVSDGTHIYIQKLFLTKELKEKELELLNPSGGVRKWGRHLFATGSLLDDSNFNRNYWMHADVWPGSHVGNQAPKQGQLIVFDDTTTYAVKYYSERNVYSPMLFPATKGYLVYADKNETEPGLYMDRDGPKPIKWLADATHSKRGVYDKPQKGKGGTGTGFTRFAPALWMDYIPVRVRGMVKTDEKLFIAGPPDVMDSEDPLAALEGRAGAKLRCIDTATGKTLAEQDLAFPPVYDGVSAARGRLYISDINGTVLCYKSKRQGSH
jgi:outer membrane protein assembly factor BamB